MKILPIKLDWDSNFYKKNIAKILINKNISDNELEFYKKNNSYDLTYVFSDNDISQILSLNPIDIKVVFSKEVSSKPFNSTPNIDSYIGDVNNNLIELACIAGDHSRFKIDKKLNHKFIKLYEKWLKKSIKREIANEVFTYSLNDKIVGFVTCKIIENTVEIGLVAVNNHHQGKGIGKKLLQRVNDYAVENELNRIDVATQLHNFNACSFYTKNNFKINSKTYIYHLWNKELNLENDSF